MTRRTLALWLLPLVLVLGGTTVGVPSASAAEPVRIMLNGDSITQGFNGDFTWRYRLWGMLTQQVAKGAPAFDLVGPYTAPWYPPGTPPYYRGGMAWDTAHDSIGGSSLANHANSAYDLAGHVAKADPDVLISYLGTVDLTHAQDAYNRSTAPEGERRAQLEARIDAAVATYENLIGELQADHPGIRIVLGEVMTHVVAPWARNRYNAALADVVAGADSPEHPVALADLDNPADNPKWDSSTYTSDLVHPTPSGEMVIAQKFALALQKVFPTLWKTAPNLPQIIIPWNPNLTPAVTVANRRISVNALRTVRTNGLLAMRVRLTVVRKKRTVTGGFVQAPTWRSGVLAPGYYRVQIQGLRKNMISTWSKPRTVKVPAPPKRKKRR
jgi:lysophospholipase L1-like esterase